MKNYIKIVPYSENLIKTLAQDIASEFLCELDKVNIVFTHKRPVHFFYYYLSKRISNPFFLGKVMPFEDWIDMLFFETIGEYKSYVTLNEYDQAYVAYICAMKVLPAKHKTGFGEFFPWAIELVSIIRELDLEMVVPENILYPPESKLDRVGQEILKRLGEIYLEFNKYLEENKYITPWKKVRFLADQEFEIKDPYFFVGFFALTKAESKLLEKFFNQGARFYWHGEFSNLPEIYEKWLKDWNIDDKDIIHKETNSKNRKINIFEAHDLHSELEGLKKHLKQLKDNIELPDQVAIVLPDPRALIPTMYMLPKDNKINITMGYPFNLSGIFILIDLLFTLILKKDDKLGYPTTEFLKVLKGPYFRENKRLAILAKVLEESSDPFITRDEIEGLFLEIPLDLFEEKIDSNIIKLDIDQLFDRVILPIERSNCLKELGNALWSLIKLISNYRDETIILERKFFAYLVDECLPMFEDSMFSKIKMKTRELFAFALKIISKLRVPFEGEPLCGLQVMGILESRDLSFKEVYILDVNEGVLPGVSLPNPLFPLEIRESLGFPTREREEAIYKYHFQRLIQSSDRVNLFYQNKTVSSGDIEGKKIKSRFIERILWDLEKFEVYNKNKSIDTCWTNNIDLVIEKSSLDILVPKNIEGELLKDDYLKQDILANILKITPSMLNQYIKCPKQFLFSNILNIEGKREIEEVRLDELGRVIHSSLQEFFQDMQKNTKVIKKTSLNLERLEEIFSKNFEASSILSKVSNSKKQMLRYFTNFRLKQFLEHFPKQTEIIYMEKWVSSHIVLHGQNIILQGRIDRIDLREDMYYVLDYKTGSLPLLGDIFKDFEIPTSYDKKGLKDIYDFIKDIQLPFYIYLYAKNNNISFTNIIGGFIDLSLDGKEKIWVSKNTIYKKEEDYNFFFKDLFPQILEYIIMHMVQGPIFGPIDDKVCNYCKYRVCCP